LVGAFEGSGKRGTVVRATTLTWRQCRKVQRAWGAAESLSSRALRTLPGDSKGPHVISKCDHPQAGTQTLGNTILTVAERPVYVVTSPAASRFERSVSNMRIINIALLGSGFVAEFFMRLANVNGQQVVLNYPAHASEHTISLGGGAFRRASRI
jgi:hypothetical protein